MSVIKRLVNVATWRVRSLFEGDAPHPAEAALDEELKTTVPAEPGEAPRRGVRRTPADAAPRATEAPAEAPAPKPRRL